MDPRGEALAITGGRFDVRLYEPSLPTITEPPYVADLLAPSSDGRSVLSPVSAGDVLWDDLAAREPKLRAFCAQRWLGAYARLGPPPEGFTQARNALHSLAADVVSPTMQRANGEVALRFSRGGFATPFFGNDVQLRVEGDVLHMQVADRVQSAPITNLADAAGFVGFDLTRFDLAAADEPLVVDAAAARYLGDVYGFAFSVLEELRARADASMVPSFVNLWPESFDVAVELGSDHHGLRAAYGVSPGGVNHAEPYAYVAPWTATPTGELWQADDFAGAQLTLSELQVVDDQRATAIAFFEERLAALVASGPDRQTH
jgi:hypothetical protein